MTSPAVSAAPEPITRVLSATGLARTYGRRQAVRHVDLVLGTGDCLALFGPNGAGKTTLLRLLAGLLKPTRGQVEIDGQEVRADAAARGRVGLVSHHTMLYPALTALENVEFTARLYGLRDPRQRAMDALQAMNVGDRANAFVRTLSRGLQQRVSIARATVHQPAVVLLDEPYAGLDDPGAQALTELLAARLARGAAMVLVTHNLAEGLALATRAAIMRDGALVRVEDRGPRFDDARFAAEYREVARGG